MIGVDLVEIDRIKQAIERSGRFKERVFSPVEIAYCDGKKNPYASYAARFAVKEAFRKIHPAFSTGIRFHEVSVVTEERGRPVLILSGQAAEKARTQGMTEFHISLSHTDQNAIAVVMAKI